MGPKSQFGTAVAIFVVSWGMVLLSMFVSVVFECAAISSYEAWAIDWLKQSELLEQEREAAADVLASWWKYKLAIKNRLKQQEAGKPQDNYSEAYFQLSAIKKYKLLSEIQYKVARAGGGDAGMPQPSLASEGA